MKDRTSTTALTRGPIKAPQLPGRLVVEFLGSLGPDSKRLDQVPAGALVSVSGTITALQPTGSDTEPRYMVTVTGPTGESAQCVVDSDRYLDVFDLLTMDAQVRVSGKVRRPLADSTSLVDVLSIASWQVRAVSA
ncbi:OB-fold nucleic acid binding domain-containing protein [Streptomyces sp. NPDC087297]|uniref:OB-fold nucleic acid binding domain-containing protein n=1 Tax=Streptomyces sp. NPDC087297 TaxID=3365778 RepID=UPI00381F28AF